MLPTDRKAAVERGQRGAGADGRYLAAMNRSGIRRALSDGQTRGLILAAVPVWAALGLGGAGRLQVATDAWAALSFVVLYPVLEELAFRGTLQGALLRTRAARRCGPFSAANLMTSAAFALAHLVAQPAAWAAAALVPSLAYGHLRERLGGVTAPILVHVVHNAGFAVVAAAAAR